MSEEEVKVEYEHTTKEKLKIIVEDVPATRIDGDLYYDWEVVTTLDKLTKRAKRMFGHAAPAEVRFSYEMGVEDDSTLRGD